MNWPPILLLGLAGFLVGGVIAAWRADARITATILAILAVGAVVGGVMWLLPAS